MTDFADIINEDLRLVLLRLLSEAPQYLANSSVLHKGAGMMGFHASRDQVNSQLDWMGENGLVKIEAVGPVKVATLTGRGLDVAEGTIKATGVARPSPRA